MLVWPFERKIFSPTMSDPSAFLKKKKKKKKKKQQKQNYVFIKK